jgi:hypothetical protein
MAASVAVAEKRRRPVAVRSRRLRVEIKLAHEPGYGKPGVPLDSYGGMRFDALAAGDCQALAVELLTCRLGAVPDLGGVACVWRPGP